MKIRPIHFFILALFALSLISCSGNKDNRNVVSFDLEKAAQSEPFNNLKIVDFKYVALDTGSNALIGDRYFIEDLAGDTIIIRDGNAERLLFFSIKNGKLVSEINHKGQGPGEYVWIDHIYVDRPSHEVVLNTPNGNAMRYTFNDSLVATYRYDVPSNMKMAIGSLGNGIYLYEQRDSGFVIHQLDKNFQETDSIVIDGYKLGYYSGEFINIGDQGVVTMADTLYAIKPGKLEKMFILNRDGKGITPDIEEELNKLNDNLDERFKKEAEYIRIMGFHAIDGDRILISYLANNKYYYDIYRITNGELLAHIPIYSGESGECGLQTDYEGTTLNLRPIFYKDGRWYAVIPEGEAIGADENDDTLNAAIVSFRFEE